MVGRDTLTASLTNLVVVDPHCMLYGMLVWSIQHPKKWLGEGLRGAVSSVVGIPVPLLCDWPHGLCREEGTRGPSSSHQPVIHSDCALSFSSEADI